MTETIAKFLTRILYREEDDVHRVERAVLIGVMVSVLVPLQALAQVTPAAGYVPPDDTPSLRVGMMIPIITRTTEELVKLVPISLREGALALGATRARATMTVVLPAAAPGIITGIVLALARIAGETAPLLFTAFNNRFFSTSLGQPISSLTVQVFTYAISPYEEWHRQAWAGALVLVTLVLLCSILARLATRRLEKLQTGH